MSPSITSYLVVAIVAATVTVMTVPLIRAVSVSRGLLVQPDIRKVHSEPTSQLGGGAMYVGFLVGFAVAWLSGSFDVVFRNSTDPFAVLLCASMSYFVGVSDDVKGLSAPAKTAGLVLAGSFLPLLGIGIIWFRVPFLDLTTLSPDLSYLITVVWVLGMANAVNLTDGLDGLAAGIVGIGAAAFSVFTAVGHRGLILARNVGPLVAALTVGVCAGFLPWNFHPAKIFMGDGGALFLGSLMAASTVAVGGQNPEPFSGQTFFFYAPLAIPVVILGVPILDTTFAIMRRASRRQGLATADKEHLHHRLMRLGHGHRRSVGILWTWTALLSGFVLWPVFNEGRGDAVVPAGVAALALVLYTSFHPGRRHENGDAERHGVGRFARLCPRPASLMRGLPLSVTNQHPHDGLPGCEGPHIFSKVRRSHAGQQPRSIDSQRDC
ncbi:MAG: MraY family glycosyltransferase [Acidimicrobiales bacterium]